MAYPAHSTQFDYTEYHSPFEIVLDWLDGQNIQPTDQLIDAACFLSTMIFPDANPNQYQYNDFNYMDEKHFTEEHTHNAHAFVNEQLSPHIGCDIDADIPAQFLYSVQHLHRLNLPHNFGDNFTVYTVDDVIDAVENCLENPQSDTWDVLSATIAHAYNPHAAVVAFTNDNEFDDFCKYAISKSKTDCPDSTDKFVELKNMGLPPVVDGIVLRNYNTPTQVSEFAYWLQHYGREYDNAHSLPVHLGEWLSPTSMVFVNMARHTDTDPAMVHNAWKKATQNTRASYKILDWSKLQKLDKVTDVNKRIYKNSKTKRQPTAKKCQEKVIKNITHSIDIKHLAHTLSRLVNSLGDKKKSHNVLKSKKKTLTRPSRRLPDNPNAPGKMVNKKYYSDIHLYVDCSLSITEDDYKHTALMIMELAKKLGVDFYFSSFANYLSPEALVPVTKLNSNQYAAALNKIPKVTGGTDFQCVYDSINESSTRKDRLNIMITDFCWSPGYGQLLKHPSTLFYIPIASANRHIAHYARDFCDNMNRYDKNIARRILT